MKLVVSIRRHQPASQPAIHLFHSIQFIWFHFWSVGRSVCCWRMERSVVIAALLMKKRMLVAVDEVGQIDVDVVGDTCYWPCCDYGFRAFIFWHTNKQTYNKNIKIKMKTFLTSCFCCWFSIFVCVLIYVCVPALVCWLVSLWVLTQSRGH